MKPKIVEETENLVIVEPSIELIYPPSYEELLKKIEICGRTAYKSENLIKENSAELFVKKIISLGHESVIEHGSITVKVICDRGISHEIVRHRIASYTQESTRYCNYTSEKFKNKIWVVKPIFLKNNEEYTKWKEKMELCAISYKELISRGWKPEEARAVLPHSLKTEICITMNIREWRHFFKLRTSQNAHPQMREIATLILNEFKERYKVFFEDIHTI